MIALDVRRWRSPVRPDGLTDRGHAVVGASAAVNASVAVTLLRQRHLGLVHQGSEQVSASRVSLSGVSRPSGISESGDGTIVSISRRSRKVPRFGFAESMYGGPCAHDSIQVRPSFMATTTIRKSALTDALGSTMFSSR